jgi:hypothetical protein
LDEATEGAEREKYPRRRALEKEMPGTVGRLGREWIWI